MTRRIALAASRNRQAGMNRTEAAYALLLDVSSRAGAIQEWQYASVTLKLADDTRYTPDFFVVHRDGAMECVEVKGFWRDDAKVKIKVAARQFPFRFTAVQAIKGGGFSSVDFTDSEMAEGLTRSPTR